MSTSTELFARARVTRRWRDRDWWRCWNARYLGPWWDGYLAATVQWAAFAAFSAYFWAL